MSDEDQEINEYVVLPDDPEMAFAILQERKYADLQRILVQEENAGWYHEQRYIDILVAFDEVYNLGIFDTFKSRLNGQGDFPQLYRDLSRHAGIVSQKFKMEAARRLKIDTQSIIILDDTSREAIHLLINAIRDKLNELLLSENKRESLFNKLNAFAAEVDRNRTRTEAFFSFVVEAARAGKKVKDELKPLQQTIDRVLDLIEKANKWTDMLPPWEDRKEIEGPPKRLAPPQQDLDDEIPF